MKKLILVVVLCLLSGCERVNIFEMILAPIKEDSIHGCINRRIGQIKPIQKCLKFKEWLINFRNSDASCSNGYSVTKLIEFDAVLTKAECRL
jgi:hypothetical protein